MCVCHSPRLIAAYHVLHRLLVPRHPSCARIHLTEEKTIVLGIQLQFPDYAIVKEPTRLPADPCSRGLPREKNVDLERHTRYRITVVGVPGIEPGTSSLSGMRSNQLSYTPDTAPSSPARSTLPAFALASLGLRRGIPRDARDGGGNRNRTGDLMLAKHVLYQLSYAPQECVTGRRSKQVLSDSSFDFRSRRDAIRSLCQLCLEDRCRSSDTPTACAIVAFHLAETFRSGCSLERR